MKQPALFRLAPVDPPAPVRPPPPPRPMVEPLVPGAVSATLRPVRHPLPAWERCDLLTNRETGVTGVVDSLHYGPGEHWMVLVKILAPDGRVFHEVRLHGAEDGSGPWHQIDPVREAEPPLARWVARRERERAWSLATGR